LGKVVGGGLPVGAYGGPAEIMAHVAPEGGVYQAGTLAGNPLATAAGLATLEVLERPGIFEGIEQVLTQLSAELARLAKEAGIPVYATQVGSMGCLFFREGPVQNYSDAAGSDTACYAKFFWGMLKRGVYVAPSQFEAMFMSSAHGQHELEQTLEAARETFAEL